VQINLGESSGFGWGQRFAWRPLWLQKLVVALGRCDDACGLCFPALTAKRQLKGLDSQYLIVLHFNLQNSKLLTEFELQYEFLTGASQTSSDIRALLGLFMAMKGQADTFLFNDPEFNTVSSMPFASPDGVTDLALNFCPPFWVVFFDHFAHRLVALFEVGFEHGLLHVVDPPIQLEKPFDPGEHFVAAQGAHNPQYVKRESTDRRAASAISKKSTQHKIPLFRADCPVSDTAPRRARTLTRAAPRFQQLNFAKAFAKNFANRFAKTVN